MCGIANFSREFLQYGIISTFFADIRDSVTSSTAYDNTGNIYDVKRVVTADATLDLAAYKAYSPLYLSYVGAQFYSINFFITDFFFSFKNYVLYFIWALLPLHYM